MQSQLRLKENRDFRKVFQRGKSMATHRLVLYHLPNREETFRVGISVSKKVGNAVVRNRLKRVVRACFMTLKVDLENARTDFVIVLRKAGADASYQDILADVVKLLRRGKFMV